MFRCSQRCNVTRRQSVMCVDASCLPCYYGDTPTNLLLRKCSEITTYSLPFRAHARYNDTNLPDRKKPVFVVVLILLAKCDSALLLRAITEMV